MNSNRREKFNFSTDLIGLIVDLGTILSFFGNLVGVVVLNNQSDPLKFLGMNIDLGPWFQLVLLLCAILAYIHFLRRYWIKLKRDNATDDPLSNSFSEFLRIDLLKFKRPILLIPILLFIVAWIWIAISGLASPTFSIDNILGFLMLAFPAGLFFFLLNFAPGFGLYSDLSESWNRDKDRQELWFKRIEGLLMGNGYISTEMFENRIGSSITDWFVNKEINWALKRYFDLYEHEKGLILSDPYSITRNDNNTEVEIACYKLSYVNKGARNSNEE